MHKYDIFENSYLNIENNFRATVLVFRNPWYLRIVVGRFCDHNLQNEELPGLNGFPLQNSYLLQAAHLVRTVSVPILQARTSQHLCLLMSLQHKCD